jgi:hypothetical protein
MTFDEWTIEYFGANVDFPRACQDAWETAANVEREACAKLCEDMHGYETTGYEYAEAIRNRMNIIFEKD